MKDEKILDFVSSINNRGIIFIETSLLNFKKRDLSDAKLFRMLKNGLYSFNRITNRDYFKFLSGGYTSHCSSERFTMYILYDADKSQISKVQVITRLKKILGLECSIEIGEYILFEERFKNFIKYAREFQLFGDCYYERARLKK